MLEACTRGAGYSLPPLSVSLPSSAINEVSSHWPTVKPISARTRELFKRAGKMRSFSNALKLAAQQNQWSVADRALLLIELTRLQDQLFIWNNNIVDLGFVEICITKHEQIKSRGKQAWFAVSSAIMAVNGSNAGQLEISLTMLSEQLGLLVVLFAAILGHADSKMSSDANIYYGQKEKISL